MLARGFGRRRKPWLVAAVCAAVVSGSLLGSGSLIGTPSAEAATLPAINSPGGWSQGFYMLQANGDKNMPAYPDQALAAINATVKVPNAPAMQTGQTLYYLSGLTGGYIYTNPGNFLGIIPRGWDATNYHAAMLTALAWNGNGQPGWSVAAWACNNDGCQQKTTAVQVQPGDSLQSAVQCIDGWGNCVTWRITMSAARFGSRSVDVSNRQPDGAYPTLTEALGGVGDYFGVTSPFQRPDDRILFTGIDIKYFESIKGYKSINPILPADVQWRAAAPPVPWSSAASPLAPGYDDVTIYSDGRSVAFGKSLAQASIAAGTYKVQSTVGSDRYLDATVGIMMWIYAGNASTAQQFQISRTADGFYQLRNVSSGRYLDVINGSGANGAGIQMWDGNGGCAQKWAAFSNAGGISFASECSGRMLDVVNGSSAIGTPVQILQRNGTPAQTWKVVRLS